MKVRATSLDDVLIIEPRVHLDERGYFFESHNAERYRLAGIDTAFVQTNVSQSSRGTLRGLHYQHPHAQGKLVTVITGEVYDVAVDIRRGSPTFGSWTAVMLTGENHLQLWIPPGFAHGFCVVSDAATFMYQCTTLYDPVADAAIAWDDDDLAIDWPVTDPLLSTKDRTAAKLRDVASARLPEYLS